MCCSVVSVFGQRPATIQALFLTSNLLPPLPLVLSLLLQATHFCQLGFRRQGGQDHQERRHDFIVSVARRSKQLNQSFFWPALCMTTSMNRRCLHGSKARTDAPHTHATQRYSACLFATAVAVCADIYSLLLLFNTPAGAPSNPQPLPHVCSSALVLRVGAALMQRAALLSVTSTTSGASFVTCQSQEHWQSWALLGSQLCCTLLLWPAVLDQHRHSMPWLPWLRQHHSTASQRHSTCMKEQATVII